MTLPPPPIPDNPDENAIALPTPKSLVYTGQEQNAQFTGYNPAKMSLGGQTSATDAGTYYATFTPRDGYHWVDGTEGSKAVSWSIWKATGNVVLDKTSVTLNSSTTSATVTATKTGDGALSVSSSNTSVATASVSGNTVTISSVNGTSGAATVTVSMAESTNYTGATATVSVSAQFVVIIGVHWNSVNSSTEMERLTIENDPNHLVNTNITTEPAPAVGNGPGSSPFDNIAPWNGMEEYNIINCEVSYKQGDVGFSRSNYDTVVKIPEYYYKVIKNGSDWYFYTSSVAASGFNKHPGSGKYVGRYNTGNELDIKSNMAPLAMTSIKTVRTRLAEKGDKWGEYDFSSWCAVGLLYLVEFSNWDSQAKIGKGYVDATGFPASLIDSGRTDSMTYHTGRESGTDGLTAVQYRHIENPWGNVSEFIEGFKSINNMFICMDRTKYTESIAAGYVDTGATVPQNSGYIQGLHASENATWAFLPDATVETGSTAIPDELTVDTDEPRGTRALSVGGTCNSGLSGGLFSFNANEIEGTVGMYSGYRFIYYP